MQQTLQEVHPRRSYDSLVTVTGVRPRMRGLPDVIATFFAVPAAYALIQHAAAAHRFAALVYGVCLVGLFGISATYHTIVWPIRMRMVMRRLDHSMIYAFIAGTYTPLCLV